jgi:hypothetical protein
LSNRIHSYARAFFLSFLSFTTECLTAPGICHLCPPRAIIRLMLKKKLDG